MELGEKLVQLRALAGEQRGLGRPMTQTEVAQAVRAELGVSLSQAYLSQLERGKRVHLSNTSRATLARFFQVHPGYLVSDLPDHSDTACAIPAAPHKQQSTAAKEEALREVRGLALAPDLGAHIEMARQHGGTAFPASERRDVPLRSTVPLIPTPHAPAWIGDPVPGSLPVIPGSASYPSRFAHQPASSQRPPMRTHPSQVNIDARLRNLLSRLRDHPQSGRVLALVEQITLLSPEALDETEALVLRLSPRDE